MILTKKTNIIISVTLSVISLVASLLTSFVFVGFLLKQPQIGDINYGLKTTADSLISFVSVFTVGMGSTFLRFKNKYHAEESKIISAFKLIMFVFSLIIILFGIIIVILTYNGLILSPEKYSQSQIYDFIFIFIISILFTVLSCIFGIYKWHLESEKHIIFVRVINLACILLYPTIATPLVLSGAKMTIVTLIYSGCYLAGYISYFLFKVLRLKKINHFSFRIIDKQIIKEVLVFTVFVVLISGIQTFNTSVDKLLLTTILTANFATIYQLSMTLNQILLSLENTLYAPYLPYLAEDIADSRTKQIQSTFDKISSILLLLSFTLLVGFTFVGKEFVEFWVGIDHIDVYYLTIIIFAAWPFYCIVGFSTSLHRLADVHRKTILFHLTSFLIHLVATISLIKFIGIYACALGMFVSMTFLGVSLTIFNRKKLGISQKSFFKKILFFSIASVVCLSISFTIKYFNLFGINNFSVLSRLLIYGVIVVVVWLVTLSIVFYKKTASLFMLLFVDKTLDNGNYQLSVFSKIKIKLKEKKESVNKLFSYIFIIYFLLNFSSYYLGGLSSISFIVSSTYFSYLTKFLSYFVLFIYLFIFSLANSVKVDKNLALLSAFTIISITLSAIILPYHNEFIYVNKYGFTNISYLDIGILNSISGYLNSLFDIVLLSYFVAYFRKTISFNNIKPFLLFIVLFTLVECALSFVFQYEDYIKTVLPNQNTTQGFAGYATNISGSFSSKNGLGFCLFQGIVSAFALMLLEMNQNKKKLFYIFPLILFHVVLIFSLCKTSLISTLLIDVVITIFYLLKLKNKNKITFYLLVSTLFAFLIFFVLGCVHVFKQIKILDSFFTKIDSLFINSGDATISSRMELWGYASRLLNNPYIIFGYGKSSASDFLRLSSLGLTQTFHNSILEIICSYGVFGEVLFCYSLIRVFSNLWKGDKRNVRTVYLIALLAASFLYGMTESAIVIFSSSSVMLVSNILLSSNCFADCKAKNVIGEDVYEEIFI